MLSLLYSALQTIVHPHCSWKSTEQVFGRSRQRKKSQLLVAIQLAQTVHPLQHERCPPFSCCYRTLVFYHYLNSRLVQKILLLFPSTVIS